MLALTESGPGRPSVDASAFPRLKATAGRSRSSRPPPAAATLLTAERGPAVEAAPAEDDVEAPRQERFTRESSQVEA